MHKLQCSKSVIAFLFLFEDAQRFDSYHGCAGAFFLPLILFLRKENNIPINDLSRYPFQCISAFFKIDRHRSAVCIIIKVTEASSSSFFSPSSSHSDEEAILLWPLPSPSLLPNQHCAARWLLAIKVFNFIQCMDCKMSINNSFCYPLSLDNVQLSFFLP